MQEKPLGQSNCLKGKTFVITGTLDSLYRNEAEDYIKRHSGRVTGSVSGKTTFLLVGENSGNSKVNQVSCSMTMCVQDSQSSSNKCFHTSAGALLAAKQASCMTILCS